MKKLILSLMGVTLGCAAFAASCVSVKQVSTNYADKTVTFVLNWSGCNGTNHLNTVWCFVDWRTVDAAGNKGAWTHATVDTPTVTGASLGSVQANGFWVTGNSSATVTVKLDNAPDMFDWCTFASDCKSVVPAATVTGCANSTICLGESGFGAGFTSTQTWRIGSQTWSAPVTATYCNKTTYSAGSSGAYNSDCRTSSSAYGHVFNWCMVARFQETLCPGDWRVPTTDDFCTLDKVLNSRSNCSIRNDIASLNRYLNTWGGQYGSAGSDCYYWSQSGYSQTQGYYMVFDSVGRIYPQYAVSKNYEMTLRCVK